MQRMSSLHSLTTTTTIMCTTPTATLCTVCEGVLKRMPHCGEGGAQLQQVCVGQGLVQGGGLLQESGVQGLADL